MNYKKLLILLLTIHCVTGAMEPLSNKKRTASQAELIQENSAKISPLPSLVSITTSDAETIIIEKTHALHCQTLKNLFAESDNPDTLSLPVSLGSLTLIKPYFELGFIDKPLALAASLYAHSIEQLVTLANAFSFLDSTIICTAAIKVLARKLVNQPDQFLKCLKNDEGSYHFGLTADMQRLLAQAMLKLLPELQPKILLHEQLLVHNNNLLERTSPEHPAPLVTLQVNPKNNRFFATASSDGAILLWNAADATPVGKPLIFTRDFNHGLVINSEGTQCASIDDENGNITLWTPGTESQTTHTNCIGSLYFNPELVEKKPIEPDNPAATCTLCSDKAATLSRDATIKLWESVTPQDIAQVDDEDDRMVPPQFSPDGRCIALANTGDVSGISIIDTKTGKEIKRYSTPQCTPICYTSFSPDGTLFAATDDTTIFIWETDTDKLVAQITGDKNNLCALCFSPDGKLLASATEDGTVCLWDTTTYQQVTKPVETGILTLTVLRFSNDGSYFAVASGHDGKISLWNISTGTQLGNTLTSHSNWISALCFTNDGNTLLSASYDKTFKMFTLAHAELSHWFSHDCKPEQVVALHYLLNCIEHQQMINNTDYPGFAKINETLAQALQALSKKHAQS